MDRNTVKLVKFFKPAESLSARRAWIEILLVEILVKSQRSLSARRAWIEIPLRGRRCRYHRVALRKESVDRNLLIVAFAVGFFLSLSARRAWIEIKVTAKKSWNACKSLSARRAWIEISEEKAKAMEDMVALRKESVDRNHRADCAAEMVVRRSPQGERG